MLKRKKYKKKKGEKTKKMPQNSNITGFGLSVIDMVRLLMMVVAIGVQWEHFG